MPHSKDNSNNSLAPRRCPSCAAVFVEGTFCEVCGETLAPILPEHSGWTGPPTLPIAAAPPDVRLVPSARARRLVDLRELSVGRALGLVRDVLDVASRFERDGLTWRPRSEDISVEPDGTISLARARAVGRLLGARYDARWVLAALRAALLPEPLVRAGADVIRVLSGGSRPLSTREALDALALARRRSAAPLDHAPVAAVTDVGLRRGRNEDASAVWRSDGLAALVVCDGVSSSSHGDIAASIGARTACDELARRAPELGAEPSPDALRDALHAAIRAAHEAIVEARIEDEGRDPPGSTIVAALVTAQRLAVAWVGDSRAYLFSPDGNELLTRDHSWLNQAVSSGEVTIEDVSEDPMAHALTRCIGPLEHVGGSHEARPDSMVRELRAGGRLVLCSDGLWGYFEAASALAEAASVAGGRAWPAEIARALVDQALARGGQDNATAAVCDVGSLGRSALDFTVARV